MTACYWSSSPINRYNDAAMRCAGVCAPAEAHRLIAANNSDDPG